IAHAATGPQGLVTGLAQAANDINGKLSLSHRCKSLADVTLREEARFQEVHEPRSANDCGHNGDLPTPPTEAALPGRLRVRLAGRLPNQGPPSPEGAGQAPSGSRRVAGNPQREDSGKR